MWFPAIDREWIWGIALLGIVFSVLVGLSWWRDRREWTKRVGNRGWPTWPAQEVTLVLSALFCGVGLWVPQSESVNERPRARDIMVILDVSQSMAVEDGNPNRFGEAKREVDRWIRDLPFDRLGLISFAGSVTLRCPLSADRRAFYRALDRVSIGSESQLGTDLSAAVSVALERLGSSTEGGAIVVFSDGENHTETSKLESLALAAKAQGIPIFLFGFGTQDGGKIPSPQGFGYLSDEDGTPILSRGEWESMIEMARLSGGAFIPPRASSSFDFSSLLEQQVPSVPVVAPTKTPHHRVWIGLSLFFLLLARWLSPKSLK